MAITTLFITYHVVSYPGRIEHSDEQKRKKIEGWVASVNGIHKEKPPPTVNYLRKMPDIEALMQV